MPLETGRLRHLILIMHNVLGPPNDLNEKTETPTMLAKVWSEITPLRAVEKMVAQQVQSKVTHKIVVRYLNTITTDCWIEYSSRTFKIDSLVNTGERNEYQELRVIELGGTQ